MKLSELIENFDINLNPDLLSEEELEEAKDTNGGDYARHWHEYPKGQKHYTSNGKRRWGYWIYNHRENAGSHFGDGTIVHHKNHNKHDNSRSNLRKINSGSDGKSRATHAIIDPNARKHTKCKICGAPHYANGLCEKHYMRKYRLHEDILSEETEVSFVEFLKKKDIEMLKGKTYTNNNQTDEENNVSRYKQNVLERAESAKKNNDKLVSKQTGQAFGNLEAFIQAVENCLNQQKIPYSRLLVKDICTLYYNNRS